MAMTPTHALPPTPTGYGAAADAAQGTAAPTRRTTEGAAESARKSVSSAMAEQAHRLNNIKQSAPENLTTLLGTGFDKEVNAIEALCAGAIPADVTLTDLPAGEYPLSEFPDEKAKDEAWLYDVQMGRRNMDGTLVEHPDASEIIRIVQMYDMLPSELLSCSELAEDNPEYINVAWMNQAFINFYNVFAAEDANTHKKIVTIHPAIDLVTLPRNISNLTSLVELHLTGGVRMIDGASQLTHLPVEINMLTRLARLYLNGNNLRTLPVGFSQLPALRILDLDKNKFTTQGLSEAAQIATLETMYAENPLVTQEDLSALFQEAGSHAVVKA